MRLAPSGFLLTLGLLAACAGTRSTTPGPFPSLQALRHAILAADPAARTALWDTLVAQARLPYIAGDSVAFLYRGDATTVQWQGSFNAFGRMTQVPNTGQRLGDTDWWLFAARFPTDARLDYWIEADGERLLDDTNPHVFKPVGQPLSSELRMPRWRPSPWIAPQPGVPTGTLSDSLLIDSEALGYRVHYRVYTPPAYERRRRLPTVYVTDGPSYYHEDGGRMPIILDNLLAAQKIPPLVVVFLDPKDPEPPHRNRRNDEYLLSNAFATFVAEELVPVIDAAYRTDRDPAQRAILGSSYGGLNAAFFALARPNIFRKIGMQSPALEGASRIYDRYVQARLPADTRFFISTGTIADTRAQADRFVALLEQKGATFTYHQLSDSHTWGNYRATLDDALIYLWSE